MTSVRESVRAAHAVATLQAVGATTVAMEGLMDTVKQGWAALKAKVAPTDHEAILQKLAYVSKMRLSIREIKSQVSNAQGDVRVTRSLHRLVQHLPVSANTPDQLVSAMATYRKRIDILIRKAAAAQKPEDIQRTRQELIAEFSKKGSVSSEMTFSKGHVLKVLDELDALAVTIDAAGRAYQARFSQGSKDVQVAQEGIALESYEAALSVAMEGVFGIIGGTFLLLGAIIVKVVAIFVMIGAIGCFLTLNFMPAIGAVLVGSILSWTAALGLAKADEMILDD